MFIYTETISPRHTYVSYALSQRLGIPFRWTSDKTYLNSNEDVFFYVQEAVKGKPCIHNCGLLDESNIHNGPITNPSFFNCNNDFLFGEDILAIIFFVLSRYEEYMIEDVDEHDRFEAKNSFLFKTNKLLVPLVDELIYKFGDKLKELFNIELNPPSFSLKPGMDVDVAYAYIGRPFWLTLAGYFKDLKNRNFKWVKQRFRVNTGLENDPYNTYDVFKDLCSRHKLKPDVFIQVGYRGKYDKNLSPYSPQMKELIKELTGWANIGMHPSHQSFNNTDALLREKQTLESSCGKDIIASRQHFLRFRLPSTYYELINCGIKHDYSMGYSSHLGFRAGTCHTFPFFDLNQNKATSLIIHPFALMDGTLKDQMNCDIESAKGHIKTLIDTVKAYHGNFSFIWHNSSFSEPGGWSGWTDVLEFIFKCAAND